MARVEASAQEIVAELIRRKNQRGKIYELFPEEGPLRRELYPQHMKFFEAGAKYTSRLAQCANGVGKTFSMGGYETALHLTGLYPEWWTGYRYEKPIRSWVVGKTKETTRDNQQSILLGPVNAEKEGGGLVPTDAIDLDSLRRRPQGGGAIDYCRIKHVSGGWSRLAFKSYDQGVAAFFGENLDLGWMDEPSPVSIYAEIMARFRGSPHPTLILTFTPKDMRAEQLALLDMFHQEESESRIVIPCAWDDVPHLSEDWKRDTLENTPAYMRETVSKGVLALGAGAVYPVPEDRFVIDPLDRIPETWRRIAGFDGGWRNTAAVWLAWDKDSDVLYLYSEHKAGELAVPLHAAAIKARGAWVPMIGDAAATNQTDGKKIMDEYKAQGVRIRIADKAAGSVDAGIQNVLTRLLSGRLKVYSTCQEFLREYRTYHYDERTGKVVKVNDHLMDAVRYACMGLKYAKSALEAGTDPTPYVPGQQFGRRY